MDWGKYINPKYLEKTLVENNNTDEVVKPLKHRRIEELKKELGIFEDGKERYFNYLKREKKERKT